jgi:hypothetical protein
MEYEYSREYRLHVILGDPALPPLWEWERWSKFQSCLIPLLSLSSGQPAVEIAQFEVKGTKRVPLKFGKLGWKESDHRKWTHESPESGSNSAQWKFLGAQVWAPSRAQCTKSGRPPEVYLAFKNEAFSRDESVRFNPSILLAVASDVSSSHEDVVKRTLRALAEYTRPILAAVKVRPWGLPFHGVGHTAFIDILLTTGLFNLGPRHSSPPKLDVFRETSWTDITETLRAHEN